MAHDFPRIPWMVQFPGSTDSAAVPRSQLKAAFAISNLDHLCSLDVHSEPATKQRLMGIICSIGPKTRNLKMLEDLMAEGMTIARLNCVYYSNETLVETINMLREAAEIFSKKIGRVYPLGIAVDLKGSTITTGNLHNANLTHIMLQKDAVVKLTANDDYQDVCNENYIYVDYPMIDTICQVGDKVVLNKGAVIVSIQLISGGFLHCKIENTGKIGNRSSVVFPNTPLNLPFLSDKDKGDLEIAIKQEVDFIFAKVNKAKELRDVKEYLGEEGKSCCCLAKIESMQAVDNIDEIIPECHGIVLSRGVLGIEIPPEKLFIVQKSLLAKALKAGVPSVCMSHLLSSMTTKLYPTRAEATDVANAVLDGADSLLLSGETAVGENPLEALKALVKLCREAEIANYHRQLFSELSLKDYTITDPTLALAISAVEASLKCNAATLLVLTTTGRSARLLARCRPRCPIVAVTRHGHAARKLRVWRAVDSLHYIAPPLTDWNKDVDKRLHFGMTYAKVAGLVTAGDTVVAVYGVRQGAGFTNTMRIVYASQSDTVTEQKPKQ